MIRWMICCARPRNAASRTRHRRKGPRRADCRRRREPRGWQEGRKRPMSEVLAPDALECPFHGLLCNVPGTLHERPPNGGFKAVGEKNLDGWTRRGVVNRTHRTSGGSSDGRFPSAAASRRHLRLQLGRSCGAGGALMPDPCVLSVERSRVPFKAGRSRARRDPVLLKRDPDRRLRNRRGHPLVLFG